MKAARVIITVVVTTFLIAGCRQTSDDGIIHLNGRIEAPTVDLGPKVPGRVVQVLVREGDRVKAGALQIGRASCRERVWIWVGAVGVEETRGIENSRAMGSSLCGQ